MTKIRYLLFGLLIVAGITLFYLGTQYYLTHFDIGPQPGDSWISLHYDYLGTAMIIIAPLVLKKYKASISLLALAILFELYLRFA